MVQFAGQNCARRTDRPQTSGRGQDSGGEPAVGLILDQSKARQRHPCFYGTRVPLKNLFDSIAAGETLDEFLDGFEGVSREQALMVLELAGDDSAQ